MHRLDEGDALGFLCMGLEKGDTLLQALHIDYSRAGIARIAYPTAKCPGDVTMVEVEFFGKLATALTNSIARLRRASFFARRRLVAAKARCPPPPRISHTLLRLLQAHKARKRQFFTDRPHGQLPNNCRSFPLSPRACNSLKSAAKCSPSNFIHADAQKIRRPQQGGAEIRSRW